MGYLLSPPQSFSSLLAGTFPPISDQFTRTYKPLYKTSVSSPLTPVSQDMFFTLVKPAFRSLFFHYVSNFQGTPPLDEDRITLTLSSSLSKHFLKLENFYSSMPLIDMQKRSLPHNTQPSMYLKSRVISETKKWNAQQQQNQIPIPRITSIIPTADA